ncbi:MAG: murein biosynthesis integral membrane protein MurJ [Cyanobacteria bacterium SZAS TMP-1]|nr:murein biosynthesis integral membrane protein MurJ [Cyanobacteria bacterium SZAS TMP-1]
MPAKPTKDSAPLNEGEPGANGAPEELVVQEEQLFEASQIIEQEVAGAPEIMSQPELAQADRASKPNEKKKPGLAKVFSLVFLFTIFSKFAGLARDMVVLSAYGAGLTSDAYNYAYLVTGNILVLFGGLGGPFHQSTVSVLTTRKNSEDIGKLAAQLLIWTALITGLFSIAVYFAAPYIVPLAMPGTAANQAELWATTITQLRIMIPLIIIAGLVGIGCGISNIYEEYFWPSMAPAVASVAIIIAVLGFRDEAGLCLGIGTTIGALGQLFVQFPGIMKARPKFFQLDLFQKLQPGTKEYLNMLWPAFFTTGIGSLTVYVDMFFTSRLEQGGWTAIVNANKLVQLPLGVLLTAMLVPMLPRFTELVAAQKIDALKEDLRRALKLLWFLALPLSAIMLALPGPIIKLLFARGQFDQHAVDMFTLVLVFQVPSIFFYVARDLVVRVFFAYQDSKTPYKIAVVAIFVKAFLDWLLVVAIPLGIGGIALSTTIMTGFNLTLLSLLLRKKIGNLGATKLFKPVVIMLSASLACGLASLYCYSFTAPIIENLCSTLSGPLHSLGGKLLQVLQQILAVGLASSIGMIVYVAVCQICRLSETTEIVKRLQSRFKVGSGK